MKIFLKLGPNSKHEIKYSKLLYKCNHHYEYSFGKPCYCQYGYYQFTIKWGDEKHTSYYIQVVNQKRKPPYSEDQFEDGEVINEEYSFCINAKPSIDSDYSSVNQFLKDMEELNYSFVTETALKYEELKEERTRYEKLNKSNSKRERAQVAGIRENIRDEICKFANSVEKFSLSDNKIEPGEIAIMQTYVYGKLKDLQPEETCTNSHVACRAKKTRQ